MADFDLAAMERRDVYQLLTRVVGPRPIAFVSSLDPAGRGNLAPFSFFAMGGLNPPSLVFCPVNTRDGAVKDTVRNVETAGEFVVNVVTRAMAERMSQASWSYPPEVDEFDAAGFTRAPAVRVKPPRVAESPVAIECRLHRIVRHGEGPLASNYVIGEAVFVHVDESVLSPDGPDARKLDLIGRLGGDWYAHAAPEALFTLPRPDKG
ncbi:MAG: flavin reductase family protein [Candidatus Krumholzibacteriia bacterium]|nr:flavin reductase family protein [bacterium]MCB9514233.1 flavin reductase family protein [Candidatus Latescibacterota bacterium]MCB9515902.1 flavin reductase family protein [Candidatus Latescibacterota bacterium]